MHKYLKLDNEYYKLNEEIKEDNLCSTCPYDEGMSCIPARENYEYVINDIKKK